jgi:alkanesulfonate monooxygenase SsuD/methylene tetrahydromethanopterin reductase-like flavin-dependent oxidoreductase (luciferase family)
MNIDFIAIALANLSRAEILAAAATTAERVGFSTLWTAEHIVFVETIRSEYPYARTTTAPPVPTDLSILNPFSR